MPLKHDRPDFGPCPAPHLIFETALCKAARPDRSPSELAHQGSHAAARRSIPALLWDLQDVEQRLRADALDRVVAYFAAQLEHLEHPEQWVVSGRSLTRSLTIVGTAIPNLAASVTCADSAD